MIKILLVAVSLLASLSAAQDACTLCYQGYEADLTLTTDTGESCGSLAAAASTIATLDLCIALQVEGFNFCGCPAPPIVDSCSICPGGSQDYDQDKPIYLFFANITTCGELAALASFVNASDGCEIFDVHAGWCGCPGVAPPCSLCPDGSSPPDPDITLPFSNTTCGVAAYGASLSFLDDVESDCTGIQLYAGLCGCTGVDKDDICTLCPNGESPPSPNSTVDGVPSCETLAVIASLTPSDQCSDIQTGGVLFCGCSPGNQTTCAAVCSDGSSIPDPDNVAFVTGDVPITCGQLNPFVAELNAQECLVATYIIDNVCGCKPDLPLPLTCSLCEDGSFPPKLFEEVVPNSTCIGLAALFAGEETGSQSCTSIQATAGVYCGCINPLASQGACRLCGDSSLVYPAADAGVGGSCGEIEFAANAGAINCSDAQALVGSACCNPNPTTGSFPTVAPMSATCLLCSVAEAQVTNPNLLIPTPAGMFTCLELYNAGATGLVTAELCPLLEGLFEICGCQGIEPICFLCGDETSVVTDTSTLIPTPFGEFTCPELYQAGLSGLVSEDNCGTLQSASALCDCQPGELTTPTKAPRSPVRSPAPVKSSPTIKPVQRPTKAPTKPPTKAPTTSRSSAMTLHATMSTLLSTIIIVLGLM